MFLKALHTSGLTDHPGIVFLASSAGAMYGEQDVVFTEESPVTPRTAYGRAKLRQEQLLTEWRNEHSDCRALIGRIATVFGPNQNPQKSQGLISHVSKCIIERSPIHIFVPLDTVRDYIFSEDCALHIVLCLEKMLHEETPSCVLKIFASERVTTIASIIGIFRRIAAQPPHIVSSAHPSGAMYQHYMRFRSVVWPEVRPQHEHSLVSAIAAVHAAELLAYQSKNTK